MVNADERFDEIVSAKYYGRLKWEPGKQKSKKNTKSNAVKKTDATLQPMRAILD